MFPCSRHCLCIHDKVLDQASIIDSSIQCSDFYSLLTLQPEYGHVVTEGGALYKLASACIQDPAPHDVPVSGQPLHSMRLHLQWRINATQNILQFR